MDFPVLAKSLLLETMNKHTNILFLMRLHFKQKVLINIKGTSVMEIQTVTQRDRELLQILELNEEDLSLNNLRKAYKSKAKEFHPDKNNGSEESEAKFKEISEAYSELLTKFDKDSIKDLLHEEDVDDFDLFLYEIIGESDHDFDKMSQNLMEKIKGSYNQVFTQMSVVLDPDAMFANFVNDMITSPDNGIEILSDSEKSEKIKTIEPPLPKKKKKKKKHHKKEQEIVPVPVQKKEQEPAPVPVQPTQESKPTPVPVQKKEQEPLQLFTNKIIKTKETPIDPIDTINQSTQNYEYYEEDNCYEEQRNNEPLFPEPVEELVIAKSGKTKDKIINREQVEAIKQEDKWTDEEDIISASEVEYNYSSDTMKKPKRQQKPKRVRNSRLKEQTRDREDRHPTKRYRKDRQDHSDDYESYEEDRRQIYPKKRYREDRQDRQDSPPRHNFRKKQVLQPGFVQVDTSDNDNNRIVKFKPPSRSKPRDHPHISCRIPVSLEDLYYNNEKVISIKARRNNEFVIHDYVIKPALRRKVWEGHGDQFPGQESAGDLVIQTELEPTKDYYIQGEYDLVKIHKMSLYEYIYNDEVNVEFMGEQIQINRALDIQTKELVTIGYPSNTFVYPNKGLIKENGERGNLIIKLTALLRSDTCVEIHDLLAEYFPPLVRRNSPQRKRITFK